MVLWAEKTDPGEHHPIRTEIEKAIAAKAKKAAVIGRMSPDLSFGIEPAKFTGMVPRAEDRLPSRKKAESRGAFKANDLQSMSVRNIGWPEKGLNVKSN
jgi:hypothetical protein